MIIQSLSYTHYYLKIFKKSLIWIQQLYQVKELDDISCELEFEAIEFQKEFSSEEDELRTFSGNTFVSLRNIF